VSQGVSLLANAFEDSAFLRREANQLMRWIDDV
jgi:hypothetical protein